MIYSLEELNKIKEEKAKRLNEVYETIDSKKAELEKVKREMNSLNVLEGAEKYSKLYAKTKSLKDEIEGLEEYVELLKKGDLVKKEDIVESWNVRVTELGKKHEQKVNAFEKAKLEMEKLIDEILILEKDVRKEKDSFKRFTKDVDLKEVRKINDEYVNCYRGKLQREYFANGKADEFNIKY